MVVRWCKLHPPDRFQARRCCRDTRPFRLGRCRGRAASLSDGRARRLGRVRHSERQAGSGAIGQGHRSRPPQAGGSAIGQGHRSRPPQASGGELGKATRAARHRSVAARFPGPPGSSATERWRRRGQGRQGAASRARREAETERSGAAERKAPHRASGYHAGAETATGAQRAGGGAVADLAAAKQAIALVAKAGRAKRPCWRDRSAIRWCRRWSNGRCCAIRGPGRIHALRRLHPRQSRIDRALRDCAGAPRRGCGRSGATPPSCAASSARHRRAGGPARGRAHAGGGGRPRRRRARSAHGLAVGAAVGRPGGRGARCIRRRAEPLRP